MAFLNKARLSLLSLCTNVSAQKPNGVRSTACNVSVLAACLSAALLFISTNVTAFAESEIPPIDEKVQISETVTNGFIHPGIGLTKEMLLNARKQVLAKREPWYSGYVALATHPLSAENVKCRNQSATNPAKPEFDAFDSRAMDARLKQDAYKAKQQALMYFFTGNNVYRKNAMTIVRVWSQMNPAKFKKYSEAYIHASYPIQDLVIAAELLRYTNTDDPKLTWSEGDTKNFTANFAVPAANTFLNENGWFMNQNGYPLAAAMSVDIFTSDRKSYEKRVEWFTVNQTAPNRGWSSSITDLARKVDTNAITGEKVATPIVQLMEMGRDQAHAGDDVEIFTNTARQMNGQRTKVDPVTGIISTRQNAVGPYEFLNDRILAAADSFCRFMLGYDTPWIPAAYDIGPRGETRGVYPRISDNYRGRIRGLDIWDMYYYYACHKDADLAKQAPYYYEAFTKRIVSSVTDWIYIPESVVGEGARIASREMEPNVVEVEQRSTLFTPNATFEQEDKTAFVRIIPSEVGTRIAILSADTDRKTIGMRIRSTGVAEATLSGMAKPWLLPNTQGQWRNLTYTMGGLERFGNIVYITVKGNFTDKVDFDNLQRKIDAQPAPLAFDAGTDELQVVAYVGAPVVLKFSTNADADGNGLVQSLDKPQDASLDEKTGVFHWRPNREGQYFFVVQVTAGDAMAAERVRLIVVRDRASALKTVESGYEKKIPYVKATLSRFQTAMDAANRAETSTNGAVFYQKMLDLQKAVNGLQLLSPYLADGSLDYRKLVVSSNVGESLGLLADGNNDTFPPYTLAKDLNYVFDFGSHFQISPSSFAIEGRLNFENRAVDTVFFGSNDGKKWTQLTVPITDLPTKLMSIKVIPERKNSKFRFLKVEKVSRNAAPLFEPSELRIYGERTEAD